MADVVNTHITKEDVKLILANCDDVHVLDNIEHFSIQHASDKMLGFLAEYWKVKVHLSDRKVLYFFIKSISKTNEAKASMVKELRLFYKEAQFYAVIKKNMEMVTGIRPWAPKLIATLNDALVFEDLNARQYKLRNKFQRFDIPHAKLALQALARFHASSIIFEEQKSKEMDAVYRMNIEYSNTLFKAGYDLSSEWIVQCMSGALQALNVFSKYGEEEMNLIKSHWRDVWCYALDLCETSPHYRNVICHCDLWNNNIMFHYDKDLSPDDCVLIDFQAIMYHPPAADIMVLLYCNLHPQERENNLQTFLNFYYEELDKTLYKHNIDIKDILPRDVLNKSVELYRPWGIIVCACLLPQFWIDDDLMTKIFCDNDQFDDILSKNKGSFIKRMMTENIDYRNKVIELFEEIADRYVLSRHQDTLKIL